MKGQKLFKIFGLIIGVFLSTGLLPRQSEGNAFYADKNIVQLQGFGVGSGPDIHGRLVARHLGRFIAGNPKIIVKNRPGAGGTIAMNYIYNRAKPDGLTFGNASSGLLTRQLINFEGVRFDLTKIPLLAANSTQSRYFYVGGNLGISSVDDLFKHGKPIVTAFNSRGAGPDVMMELMFRLLGLERKPIYGFKDDPGSRLAVLRGEADLSASNEITYLTVTKSLEKDGRIQIIAQTGLFKGGQFDRSPSLPHVPTLLEAYQKHFGKPPSGVLWEAFKALAALPTRTYWVPPKTPEDRIQSLRKAFMDMSRDPEFQRDSKKILGDAENMEFEGKREIIDAYITLPQEIAELLTP